MSLHVVSHSSYMSSRHLANIGPHHQTHTVLRAEMHTKRLPRSRPQQSRISLLWSAVNSGPSHVLHSDAPTLQRPSYANKHLSQGSLSSVSDSRPTTANDSPNRPQQAFPFPALAQGSVPNFRPLHPPLTISVVVPLTAATPSFWCWTQGYPRPIQYSRCRRSERCWPEYRGSSMA